MTKFQIVKKVANNLNITEKDTRIILNEILDAIVEEVSNGNKVKFVDFGVFEPRNRKHKIGRNPRNVKEPIDIPAKTVPVFHAGKLFRKTVIEANSPD